MNPVTLKPITGQQFTIQPQQSHPRLSLRRILWVKFLRWVDKATWQKLGRSVLSLVGASGIAAGIIAPQFFLGVLYDAVAWQGYRVPILAAALALYFFGARTWHRLRRLQVARIRTGNQHTFHGVPVDEMASYLLEQAQFTREHAMAKLHISREKYDVIAKELEHHQILHRGENNARVLNPITREQLTAQLAERKYPLTFDETRKEWVQRDGTFVEWVLDRERKNQKEDYRRRRGIERLKKKRDALREEVGALESTGFISRVLEIA